MVTCPHSKSLERNYEKKEMCAFCFPMLFAISFQTAPTRDPHSCFVIQATKRRPCCSVRGWISWLFHLGTQHRRSVFGTSIRVAPGLFKAATATGYGQMTTVRFDSGAVHHCHKKHLAGRSTFMRSEVSTTVSVHIVAFWVMTPCCGTVRCFSGTHYS
jgi:hypothetical protein